MGVLRRGGQFGLSGRGITIFIVGRGGFIGPRPGNHTVLQRRHIFISSARRCSQNRISPPGAISETRRVVGAFLIAVPVPVPVPVPPS
ncbi:MAG: hypothetical protein GY820_04450 [Gammaproteobacteria bacterium]|nr:hypothetical protein [Gammaproteobacteria bacterium]